jgi:hypothetical protein
MGMSAHGADRWISLTAGFVVAWLILLIPMVVFSRGQEPVQLFLVQVVVSGVILGIGRQGIDLLLLRLFGASTALLASSLYGGALQHHGSLCANAQDCVQLVVLGLVAFGVYGTAVLTVVALPASVAWNRGIRSLKPELQWPRPFAWWHWLLIVSAVLIGLPLLGVLIGIPWPG